MKLTCANCPNWQALTGIHPLISGEGYGEIELKEGDPPESGAAFFELLGAAPGKLIIIRLRYKNVANKVSI